MPSYVVTGANRGIGFGFLEVLSADPSNTVIGMARDKKAAEVKVANELPGRTNIHFVQGDLSDYKSLKRAAEETAEITGGSLDCLIANATWFGANDWKSISDFSVNPEFMEEDMVTSFRVGVVGNIHLVNFFLPLIRRGTLKKVIGISSARGDLEWVRLGDMIGPSYGMQKASLNMAFAKFANEHGKGHEGILFMTLSPGVVDTAASSAEKLTESDKKRHQDFFALISTLVPPEFKGPISPVTSATLCMEVINKSSVERGDGGSFVSHHGNRDWF
ncbi:NAD(P)-binding protein [Xylariomycetidae sp. FL2044]|nr:NAD(P)-binding protein [Xylariomycetidae sp. FL2044]